MKVFVMRVGLIGKHSSSYNLFEYSLSIAQNLDAFFLFLPHCPCPEILTNKHHSLESRHHISMSVEGHSKTGSQLSGSSKFFTVLSPENYSKIDLEW